MLNTPNLLQGKPGMRENYFICWFSSPLEQKDVFSVISFFSENGVTIVF